MRHRHFAAPLLLLGFGLLAGCGQKGPLYLPTRPAALASASSTPATATPAAKPAGSATVAAPASSSPGGG
ncbi:MAG TPA: lipoprotein [Rhodanobacteraceae bacterium]|nr:lipoprotein [Rhodanobacteraceae bacterium]